jgi:hypothetical protein
MEPPWGGGGGVGEKPTWHKLATIAIRHLYTKKSLRITRNDQESALINIYYIHTIKYLAVVEGTEWVVFYISIKYLKPNCMGIILSVNSPLAGGSTEKCKFN